MTPSPATRWASALAEWAIPEPILAAAPESPWVLPPEFFKVDESVVADDRPSRRLARAALGPGGSVLDVGCGGGAASVPLVPQALQITGVDERASMLQNFAAACSQAGVGHRETEGRWPDVADEVAVADVVVCNHVVYNVTEIGPFVRALTEHARRLVVVELTAAHPTSPFNYLWEQFWQLSRPGQPSAELFLEVVREQGYQPVAESWVRDRHVTTVSRADYVAFARRRLCLPADRDPEMEAALGDRWPLVVPEVMAVAWAPPGAAS